MTAYFISKNGRVALSYWNESQFKNRKADFESNGYVEVSKMEFEISGIIHSYGLTELETAIQNYKTRWEKKI